MRERKRRRRPSRSGRRAGSDYGSADFAIFEGTPAVFDLNRTPASPAYAAPFYAGVLRDLAAGLLDAAG